MMRPCIQKSAQLGRTVSTRTGFFGLSSRAALSSVALAATRNHAAAAAPVVAASPSASGVGSPLSLRMSRLYSTEASAAAPAETAAPRSSTEGITEFEQLQSVGVHPVLVNAVTQGMGYQTMSDVQAKTIPLAITGKDIVAQAKTGTGKTLAFLIPVVQRMLQDDPSLASRRSRWGADAMDIRAIVLSPTRELAEQIAVEAEKLCRGTGIVVQRAVGGNSKSAMLNKTRREGCHLLVATPGRLNDLLDDRFSGISAPNLQALVLDEADRMLDVGFEPQLQQILTYLPDRTSNPYQTMLFSATIPPNVVQLARNYVNHENFKFVQTIDKNDTPTHHKIPQHLVTTTGYETLFPTLYELLAREAAEHSQASDLMPFKAMVFFTKTILVELSSEIFSQRSPEFSRMPILHIHGGLTQQARTRAADNFRRYETGILFSSDVTARGMDFPNVTHVIQVGLPPSRDQYIHRVGRTGRAGKSGEGWLILNDVEIHPARSMLPGIPIKPHKELGISNYTLTGDEHQRADAPRAASFVSQALRRVSPNILDRLYLATLGNTDSRARAAVAEDLNRWIRLGWGHPEPPTISPNMARKIGIERVPGINIGIPKRHAPREDRSSRNYRGMEGIDRRQTRFQPRDQFESMSRDDLSGFGRGGGGRGRGRGPPGRASF